MSAFPIVSGNLGNAPASGPLPTLWTAPPYTVSVSLRLINVSANVSYATYYLNGQVRIASLAIQPGTYVDVEQGTKLPAGCILQGNADKAGEIDWCITGIQNDGQP